MKAARLRIFGKSILALWALAHLMAAPLPARAASAPSTATAPATKPAPEYGEAFGLRLGMSREAVLALGVELEPSGVSELWGQRYRTENLPRPDGDERWVWLYFGNDNRLFRILVEFADRGTAYDSRDALLRYRLIKERLSARYAATASDEATLPERAPCFNPPAVKTPGGLDTHAEESYRAALLTGGHHMIISMMHFCAIRNWSAEFDRSDTYVTVAILPKDARPRTSSAFIRIEIASKSLKENFRRGKSSTLAAHSTGVAGRSARWARLAE